MYSPGTVSEYLNRDLSSSPRWIEKPQFCYHYGKFLNEECHEQADTGVTRQSRIDHILKEATRLKLAYRPGLAHQNTLEWILRIQRVVVLEHQSNRTVDNWPFGSNLSSQLSKLPNPTSSAELKSTAGSNQICHPIAITDVTTKEGLSYKTF
jgi:hypothetical protein